MDMQPRLTKHDINTVYLVYENSSNCVSIYLISLENDEAYLKKTKPLPVVFFM